MKKKTFPRFVAAITVTLSVIIGGIGWKNHRDLTKLRDERDSLVSLAIEKAIDLEAPLPLSTRILEPKAVRDIDRIAKDFIAYAIEFKDFYRDEEIQKLDPATRHRMIAQMDEVMSLNPDELKSLIDLISSEPQIPQNTRTALLQFSLHRLAETHRFEALSLMVGSPKILDQLGGHSRRILERHLPALASTRLDETKSWLRLHAENIPPDLLASSAYLIAKSAIQNDPMEAFAIAEEFCDKPEGYFPYIFRNRPLTHQERSACLPALRQISEKIEDAKKRAKFIQDSMEALVLGQKSHEADFKEATAWIAMGLHSDDELEFIWNPAINDLGYSIKEEETGQWITWLRETYPGEKSKRRVDQLLERWRKRDAESAATFAREHGLQGERD